MLDIVARRQISRIRPLFLMHEEGVSSAQLSAVLDAINEVLAIAATPSPIAVKNFGVWRQPNYETAVRQLTAWNSVDWYIGYAREACKKPGQIDAQALIDLMYSEPWQDDLCHYDVIITKSDLTAKDLNFCIGLAVECVGTVISINRFLALEHSLQLECIKTETMHEVGHVFGLIPEERTDNVEFSLGKHCTNRCTMRQGLSLPDDWINITKDRLRFGAFCPTCQRDLQTYFRR